MKRKVLALILLLLLLMPLVTLVACDSTDAPPDNTSSENTTSSGEPTSSSGNDTIIPPVTTPSGVIPENAVTIIKDGKTSYAIIRPDTCSDTVKNAVTDFKAAISDHYGVRITYETDWVKSGGTVTNDKHEILVGRTNRAETEAAVSGLVKDAFVIKTVNNKIVICGYDDEATVRALDFFAEYYVSGDTLYLPADLNIINKNPPEFISSSPVELFCYEPGSTPTFTATFRSTSSSTIDTAQSSLTINGTDMSSKAVWTQNQVTLDLSGLAAGSYHAVLTLVTRDGGMNILVRNFSVSDGSTMNIYRGELHSHTNVSDGKGSTEDAYKYARENGGVDFFAVTDHSYNTSKEPYLNSQMAIADSYNNPGKFVAIYGFELTYFANSGYYGHVNVLNAKEFLENNLKITEAYRRVANHSYAVAQFNHPGYSWGTFNDFGYYSEQADSVVKLIEIWGENYERYYSLALAKGWHVSPVFNEDTHDATWTTKYESLTCVLAPSLTRENIIEAMLKNRTYMTSDKTLSILYSVNGEWMGSRLSNPAKLDITVELSTQKPGGLGTVRLVGEDGITVAQVETGGAIKYKWELSVAPEYDYYYIVTTNNDNNTYAVTAPVWIEDRGILSITDLSQGLITDKAGNEDHAVTVSVKNISAKQLTDVTVRFFRSSDYGFDITSSPVLSTVKIGTLGAGGTADASAAVAYAEGTNRVTAVVTGKADGKTYTATEYTMINQLYITEILPDPDLYNGNTDMFAFIELYNNSDAEINLSGYTLRYWTNADADSNGTMYTRALSGRIKARETIVIWFKTIFNTLTPSDFTMYFGTKFTEGDNLLTLQGPKNTYHVLSKKQSMQIDIVRGAYTITRAQYNWGDKLGETVRGRSVLYDYQRYYTVTTVQTTADGTPTPGRVTASQVPTVISSADWQKYNK